MSFSNAAENNILKLLFRAETWADIAENDTSSPNTDIAFALHTADPADGGNQTTNESAYTSYARVLVARSAAGFGDATTGTLSPAAAVTFPEGTGGSGTVTHFSAGKTGGGATAIHMSGTVTPNIVTGNLIEPELTTATSFAID